MAAALWLSSTSSSFTLIFFLLFIFLSPFFLYLLWVPGRWLLSQWKVVKTLCFDSNNRLVCAGMVDSLANTELTTRTANFMISPINSTKNMPLTWATRVRPWLICTCPHTVRWTLYHITECHWQPYETYFWDTFSLQYWDLEEGNKLAFTFCENKKKSKLWKLKSLPYRVRLQVLIRIIKGLIGISKDNPPSAWRMVFSECCLFVFSNCQVEVMF